MSAVTDAGSPRDARAPAPTLVVGDVHGCADELDELVRLVSPGRVILVGDLFTKGPDPAGVWAQARDGGWEAVLGNHDDRLLQHLDGQRPDDGKARRAIERLDRYDPAWLPWVRGLPLFREVPDPARPDLPAWTVVHAGLHPDGDLDRTTRRMALLLRRWPDDSEGNPFWWEVYRGDRRVVFGHDAMRGLVWRERGGVPWVVGLDTGCVYGGRLSGLVLEEGRVVQVPARRAYQPLG